jgi:thioesterase domain-containing protein/uncharacterized protein YbdZ (MbtH family)
MAAQYLAEVRAVQPEGPYYLGGYSFGGTVAFEMARQLHKQGHKVGLLAILDQRSHPSRSGPHFKPGLLLYFLQNLPFWVWYDLFQTSPRNMLTRVRLKARAALRWAFQQLHLPWATHSTAAESAGADIELARLPEHYRDLVGHNFQILLGYEPAAYPGRVTLLRSRAQALSRFQRPDLGWGSLALEGVEVIVVPGSHDTILTEPYVKVLGKRLGACLAQAQAAAALSAPPDPDPSPLAPATAFTTEALVGAAEEGAAWRVVVNHEGQHSIWPASQPAAPGWTIVGQSGTQDECLAFIKELWTDLRPLSHQTAHRHARASVAAQ